MDSLRQVFHRFGLAGLATALALAGGVPAAAQEEGGIL